MCKYGLLARGCGHVYMRIPRRGYVEKVWDHAPGSLLLRAPGVAVAKDWSITLERA
jgi:3'-phosphoadenosine 5'-phosphosulfate (PAPS) 3'-phosphatase